MRTGSRTCRGTGSATEKRIEQNGRETAGDEEQSRTHRGTDRRTFRTEEDRQQDMSQRRS